MRFECRPSKKYCKVKFLVLRYLAFSGKDSSCMKKLLNDSCIQ